MIQENEVKNKDGCKPSAPVNCSTPNRVHNMIQPIYDYINSIKDKEPERAKAIAKICLELAMIL
ncbi:MAG: hypothetical protein QME83_10920 [Thermodesulfobacteriota bacterium]|nr:hypothetical protein [Thermodesulfobacteriota bacterium]